MPPTKGAKMDALKNKLAASEVEVEALKESLANFATSSLWKDEKIESLKLSFDDASSRADNTKVILDDALKEL